MAYRFDIRTLQIFVRVVQVSGITKAAEIENIAASAVSKRIADLEADLGVQLLRRLTRRVEPTAAGTIVYRYAREMLESLAKLADEISHHAAGDRGAVRLAGNKSAMTQFLPSDLQRFERRHPGIEITLEEMLSPQVAKAVADGEVDIGIFILGSVPTPDLQTLPYRRDRLAVLVHQGHELANRSRVRYEDLLDYDVVGADAGSAIDRLLVAKARDLGRDIRIKYKISSFDGICQMAAAGLGLAIGPRQMVPLNAGPGLIEIELDEPWAERTLAVIVRNLDDLSAPAKLLVEHLSPTFGSAVEEARSGRA